MSWLANKIKTQINEEQNVSSDIPAEERVSKTPVFNLPYPNDNCDSLSNIATETTDDDNQELSRWVCIGENRGNDIIECQCLHRNKESEEYKNNIAKGFTVFDACYMRGGKCPPVLGCNFFDAHEFDYYCREKTEIVKHINKLQRMVNKGHHFNVMLGEVKAFILDTFTKLYDHEQNRIKNKLIPETRFIINHEISREVIFEYLNKHLRLIALYFLDSYCHFPEDWEQGFSATISTAQLENKNIVSSTSILERIKQKYRDKHKKKSNSERKPKESRLITAKELEEEEYDENYIRYMESSEHD